MKDELNKYCTRHNYTLVEYYTTWSDFGTNHRAIVTDNTTHERFYLYYDRSRKRRTLAQQRKDLEFVQRVGMPAPWSKCRGWRNVTLDNRRARERRNKHHEQSSVLSTDTLSNI